MFTILGSGFGLYGYLQALLALGKYVYLPVSYKNKLLGISSNQTTNKYILWTGEDEKTILKKSNNIIFSRPPHIQSMQIEENLNLIKKKRLYLEKPLAADPKKSKTLLKLLEHKRVNYSIGYLFLYSDWFRRIEKTKFKKIFIEWTFHADHFKNNKLTWKRDHALGGGALRFYGIHLIALLAKLDMYVINSNLRKENSVYVKIWEASFMNKNYEEVLLKVNTDSLETKFIVNLIDLDCKKINIVNSSSPFSINTLYNDIRVNNLKLYLEDIDSPFQKHEYFTKVVDLWDEIEDMSFMIE